MSLLLVALIWGINLAVMKMAIINIDPFVFNSVRLTLSACVLGFCVWLENKKRRQPALSKTTPSGLKKWLTIVAFAIFTGAVYQIIFIIGMHRTTAGNTALIMSSMPMWTAILAFIVLREKIGVAWLGLMITFLGTLVVTLQKEAISLEAGNLEGNLLILLSALAWATGAVISRPMLNYVSPIRLAFYSTAGTLPLHYLMPVFFGTQDFDLVWEPEIMACIIYSGVFSTGLAYAMWNYGVQQLGASHASVYQNLVPLIALVSAWFFLNETITLIQLVGGFMIIFGLFLTRRMRKRQARATQQ